ncbi:MAG: amidohydrolase [Solirubrobacterales bacterium]
MSRVLIRNLGGLVGGRIGEPVLEVDSLLLEDGLVAGFAPDDAERTIDAAGAVAVPGFIDSHAHVVFGDWTPRQSTIGWIESSLHGGVTMMMSASEVHLPGRPHDREGVKALALAAQRAYSDYRPGGVKVLGGSVIIEPVLEPADFEQLAAEDVWLAKVGFGDFTPQADAAPLVRAAQENGFVVMNHTGGASIPDSSPVTIEDVLALGCDIVGHANGGPTALPDGDLDRLFDAPGAIQIVQAGNLRSALRIVELARERDMLDRLVLATDTPTGTGVIPLGMLRTIAELCSLGGLAAADGVAMATGNNGAVLGRPEGVLESGRPADVVLLQTPLGSAAADPLAALELGDLPSITSVLVDGEPLVMRSRNTPAPLRPAVEEVAG